MTKKRKSVSSKHLTSAAQTSKKRRKRLRKRAMSSSEVEEVPITQSRPNKDARSALSAEHSSKNKVSQYCDSDIEEVPVTVNRDIDHDQQHDGRSSPDVQEVPLTQEMPTRPIAQGNPMHQLSTERNALLPRFVVNKPSSTTSSEKLKLASLNRIDGVDLKAAQQITNRLLLVDEAIPTYHYMPDLGNACSSSLKNFLYKDGFGALHPAVDPASRGQSERGKKYGVPPKRAAKKRDQIANLVACVASLEALHRERKGKDNSSNKGRILDMCGGCGHVGLVLAALFPDWDVTVVDTRPFALDVARRRAKEAQLENVSVLQRNIEDLREVTFDIAVALHACGGASDTVLAKGAECGASVVIASCCTGGIVSTKGSVTGNASSSEVVDPASPGRELINWGLPRSMLFRSVLRGNEYSRLARAADFGEKLDDKDEWRRVAKSLLEQDRALWMKEASYNVRVLKMKPLTCTPKNDVLMAWPGLKNAQVDLSRLFQWEVDEESSRYIQEVKDGSILKGLGPNEVAEIQEVLTEKVCAESSDGSYTFPRGMGKRRRKVVHAVANSMGLCHKSDGKGGERRVSVQRSAHWPLFFERYVGVGGPGLERLSRSLLGEVPSHCVQRKNLVRGNPHHLTIIRPQEMSHLSSHFKGNRTSLLDATLNALQDSSLKALGVGRVSQNLDGQFVDDVRPPPSYEGDFQETHATSENISMKNGLNEAYFIVVEWPEANAFRRGLGLPDSDFHITLGFTASDIHSKQKNRRTLILPHEEVVSVW